jgi:cobalt/nickel transport protein
MTTAEKTKPKRLNPTIVVLGILAITILMIVPVVFVQGSEFGGSDGAGSEAILSIAPEYDAKWIANIWEPPGREMESMLFALQGVAGGILIGYFFGYKRGRRKSQTDESEE